MKHNTSNEERVSIHEAGHAVVGYVLGFRSDGVWIKPSDNPKGPEGQTSHKSPAALGISNTEDVVKFHRKYLAVRAAGHAAEEIHAGHELRLGETGAMGDWSMAQTTARALAFANWSSAKDDESDLMSEAIETARGILKRPGIWKKVDKLAAALRVQRSISGEDVDRLLSAT